MRLNQLPPDVQSRICDAISASSGTSSLACCVSVCRDWQCVFERKSFQRLILTPSCLTDFERIVASDSQRRAQVQHIHLRIQLQTYTCRDCAPSVQPERRFSLQQYAEPGDDVFDRRRLERLVMTEKNNRLVKDAVIRLFSILSTWEASCCTAGILLEISALSPSDSEHYFQADVHLDANGMAADTPDGRGQDMPKPHDPQHGWENGRQKRTPDFESIQNIFYDNLFLEFDPEELPLVPVVTKLLLRRQTRRWIHATSLQAILVSLPSLEMFMYEPWRPLENKENSRYWRDKEYYRMFSSGFPPNLKQLIVFEDFNEDLNRASRSYSTILDKTQRPEIVRTPSPSVGRALAVASRTLAALSASYLVDAQDFFFPTSCGLTTETWDRLESLVLTSLALRGESPHHEVASLITAAGSTALFMPKLRTMELWYGARQIASAFRYRVQGGSATIAWLSTRRFDLRSWPKIDKAWQQVSLLHTARPLAAISQEMLDAASITSQAEAVARLGIHCTVAHPVSLEEIRKETGHYWSFHIGLYMPELPIEVQLRDFVRRFCIR
ncbi:hypothetical protein HJFPF1_09469 [Paramyrothecium foliicola]|nr:hypothetical protein HJFPF1_09469 [Paramyrothecium foliicola]